MNNTTATAIYNAAAGYVEVALSDGTILKSKKGKNAAKATHVLVQIGWTRIACMHTSRETIEAEARRRCYRPGEYAIAEIVR
jgi:hypothetical protein